MALKSTLRDRLSQWNQRRLAKRRAAIQKSYTFKLGVLGIMKNESLNIDEWISHYLAMGAGKIYLIDNGSTDDSVAKAQKWVNKGYVEMILRPAPHQQRRHYWDAIKTLKIKKNCEWLIIADLDEFWFCPNGQPIANKLEEEQFSFLKVIYGNWRMFGSIGTEKHPESIRESITRSDPRHDSHIYTKYICRPSVLVTYNMLGIHKVLGADSAKTVSDNHNFHLNHYPIQSLQFFQSVKMKRGDANNSKTDDIRDMDYFHRYDAPCTQQNRILADLVATGRLGKGPF